MKNLRQRIQALLKSPDYRPLNKSEFARTLNLKPNERSDLRAELARLEKKGDIVYGKKGRFTPRAKSQGKGGKGKSAPGALLIGTLRFQGSGHAWFYPDANDATNEAAGMDLKKILPHLHPLHQNLHRDEWRQCCRAGSTASVSQTGPSTAVVVSTAP